MMKDCSIWVVRNYRKCKYIFLFLKINSPKQGGLLAIAISSWVNLLSSRFMPSMNGKTSNFTRPHFYQTRSGWSMDQGSNENHSLVNSFDPTVTKFCVMWEGQALPHDTKFSNCRDKIVDNRAFLSWSLIHGLSWSGLIKVGPASLQFNHLKG